jgi:hypothetical protein
MSVFQSLYDRNRHIRAFAQRLGFARPLNLETESPRIVEYPWILKNFPREGKVLDVGSSGSQLPVMLACLGFSVWTLDVRSYEYADLSTNLHSISGDLRNTGIADGFFDIVTAVSTIEHIGLGRYGDAVDPEGDRNAMREIKRIMTGNATLLITVPFGKRYTSSLHRVYDKSALFSLLEGFKIQNLEFFMKTNRLWTKATDTQVRDVDSSTRERAVACVKAVKI